MNKVIISLMILLLAATGTLSYYSFDLNKQVGTLSDRLNAELTTFREETTTQISTLSDDLTTFNRESASQIGTLSDELQGVSSEISQSVIPISRVYEKVKWGVVDISISSVFSSDQELFGSGFVFDTKGHIVTSYHILEKRRWFIDEGWDKVNVVLHDGTTSRALIVGGSKYNDIAVLKLEEEMRLYPLELADSDATAIGEPIIVIGSPLNLPGTVTSGIISQKGRFETFAEERPYYMTANLIQYSAASNPGNSGGPLLNSQGEVTGLVTGKIISGEGLNFAVTSNKVGRVTRELIDHGFFENPTLTGEWTIEDLTPEKARINNLETIDGVLVSEASASSNFEANDILISIDGITVRDVADLFNYLGEHKSPGDTVKLIAISNKIKRGISTKLAKGGIALSDRASTFIALTR